MTIKNFSLLALARQSREAAENMTGDELCAWYSEHVGYDPMADDPSLSPVQLTAMVASTMFLHSVPDEATGVNDMEHRLERSVLTGVPL